MGPLDRFREICRSLPDTAEGSHYGDVIFRVKRKMFVSFGEKAGRCQIVVQLDPERAAALLACDPRCERYPRAKNCVAIEVTEDSDWSELRARIEESYRLNAPVQATAKRSVKSREKRGTI